MTSVTVRVMSYRFPLPIVDPRFGLATIGISSTSHADMTGFSFLKRNSIQNAIIIADADEIGKKSAKKLKKDLTFLLKSGIITPEQGKDISEWAQKDGKEKVKKVILSLTN